MRIYSGTGVTTFKCNPITKPVESLIFRMPKTIASLTNELITIFIERVNGQNVYLATKVNLKQFLTACLCMQNTQAQQWLADGDTLVVVDLGLEAGVKIGVNEKIHVEIEGIQVGEQWDVYATEGRMSTPTHIKFNYASMLVGEKDKLVNTTGAEVAVLKITSDLNEIGIIRGTQEIRFLPIELQALQVEDNPILQYLATTIDQNEVDQLVIPLQDISGIRLYKEETGTIGIVTMSYADLKATANTLASTVRR